jgi:hypothetical protein
VPRTPSKKATDAAIAALPFSPLHEPTAPERFGNLPEPMRVAIAKRIADDRASGLSGAACRLRYGGTVDAIDGDSAGLSGPVRRKVLRDYGYGSVIGRSYDAYRDGDSRAGSAHARLHGPNAADRIAAAKAAVEKAERAEAAKARRRAKAAERRAAKAAAAAADALAREGQAPADAE